MCKCIDVVLQNYLSWTEVTSRAELIFKKSSNLYAQLDLSMC